MQTVKRPSASTSLWPRLRWEGEFLNQPHVRAISRCKVFLGLFKPQGAILWPFRTALSRLGKYNPNSQRFPMMSWETLIWNPESKGRPWSGNQIQPPSQNHRHSKGAHTQVPVTACSLAGRSLHQVGVGVWCITIAELEFQHCRRLRQGLTSLSSAWTI